MKQLSLKPVLQSFPPVASAGARILILGSMPGAASLAAGQYYAHPRNAFWRLMGDLYGAGPDLDYPARLIRLKKAGVALWDVLLHCERDGSLDSAIRSEIPNDFAGFLRAHPRLEKICFNGQPAAKFFRRHVVKPGVPLPEILVLPSSSPAHAGLPYAAKRRLWAAGLGLAEGSS